MHAMWLGVSALFATAVASAATVDTADSELSDPYRYTRGVRLAELGRLQALGKTQGAKGLLGQAGFYRVRGELERSSKAAQQCLQAVATEPADGVKGLSTCARPPWPEICCCGAISPDGQRRCCRSARCWSAISGRC